MICYYFWYVTIFRMLLKIDCIRPSLTQLVRKGLKVPTHSPESSVSVAGVEGHETVTQVALGSTLEGYMHVHVYMYNVM